MEFKHMFRALVLGTGVTAVGCAGKDIGSAAHPAAEPSPIETVGKADTVDPPEVDAVETVDEAAKIDGAKEDLNCEEICDYGSEAICPDPENGFEGCCWLMLIPHPCCDFEPAMEELGED